VDAIEAELRQCRERRHHRDGRAVGVLDEGAVPATLLALDLDEVDVVGVHLRDGERDIRVGPRVRGVRGDDVARPRQVGFDGLPDAGGERREQERDVVRQRLRRGPDHGRVRDAVGDGRADAPLGGLAVGSPRAPLARAQGDDLEVGVGFEQLDEPLPDRPRRTENTDTYCHARR